MDISTRQMRGFLALRDHRNFTRAATTVHLSQPAFSAMIKGLEESLGHQLIIRNSKSVHLTRAGEQFASLAEQVVNLYDEGLRSLMHGLDPNNQVALAAMVALTYEWLPPVLARLRQASPEIQIELIAAFPKDCMTLAAAQRVDLAMTALDALPPGVVKESLWRDPFGLVCRADHPLAEQDVIHLDDLLGYSFIHYSESTLARSQIDRGLHPRHLQVVCETEHIHTIKALVESGTGISLATEMNRRIFTSEVLIFKEIAGSPLAREIGLAWHMARPWTHATTALVQMLRETVPVGSHLNDS